MSKITGEILNSHFMEVILSMTGGTYTHSYTCLFNRLHFDSSHVSAAGGGVVWWFVGVVVCRCGGAEWWCGGLCSLLQVLIITY